MPMEHLSSASIWIIILLMFIGASPGSTGGGIKTTTFGLLVVALISTMKSKNKIQIYDREISHQQIFKALAILVASFTIVFFSFFVLLISEKIQFLPLLFESVSAFATVGFSMGVSSEMTDVGKYIIMGLMFFGRVGPLTLAFALTRKQSIANYTLPKENILLG